MILSCPQCETSFSLPDEMYRLGRKARCSSCGHVFPMPPMPDPLLAVTAKSDKKKEKASGKPSFVSSRIKKNLLICAVSLVAFVGVGLGGYMIYNALTAKGGSVSDIFSAAVAPARKAGTKNATLPTEEDLLRAAADYERVKLIQLVDVRQFVLKNDKLGKLVIVQGKAINNFEVAKGMIAVEATLLDEEGTVINRLQQRAGVMPTLLQLQSLDAKELASVLNNPMDILLNNASVPPKGEVPFCLIFVGVPSKMVEFEVGVIDVQEAPLENQ